MIQRPLRFFFFFLVVLSIQTPLGLQNQFAVLTKIQTEPKLGKNMRTKYKGVGTAKSTAPTLHKGK